MRSILMIVIITLCAIGCSTKDEGGTDDHNDHSTTLEEKESTLIAAVTKKQEQSLPKTWRGHEVIDGDISDPRFLDKRGVVVGLHLKKSNKIKDITEFYPFVVKTRIVNGIVKVDDES